MPLPTTTSKELLPSAMTLPPSLAQVDFPLQFEFGVPENTTGEANVKGLGPRPPLPATAPINPPPNLLPNPIPLLSPDPQLHTATHRSQYYHKRKAEKKASGISFRKYQHSEKPITCGKCKQPRDPGTHKQYFGNWYCSQTDQLTYENWREEQKAKKKTIQEERYRELTCTFVYIVNIFFSRITR